MEKDFYLDVMGLLKSHIIRCTMRDPKRQIFKFKIYYGNMFNGCTEINVTKNHKGWICDYLEPMDEFIAKDRDYRLKGWTSPTRWGCCMNTKENCAHIFVCKALLDSEDVRIVVENNVSLKEAVRLGRLRVFGNPQTSKKQKVKK